VVSVVDWVAAPNADGQTIGRGRLGTVLAGGQTGFPLLVAWDGWNNGHNGRCFAAQCGACSQSGSNKYWVYCNDVAPAP
jgi:hypothetical protein